MMKTLNSQHLIVIKSFFERAVAILEEEYLLRDRPEQIEKIIDRLLPYTENDYFPAVSPYASLAELDRLLVDPGSIKISAEEEAVVVCLLRFLIIDYILKQQDNFFKLPAEHPILTQQRLDLEKRLQEHQQEHVKYLRQALSTELQDQVPSFRHWMSESERRALLQAREQQLIPTETTHLLANAPASALDRVALDSGGLMSVRLRRLYSGSSFFSFSALLIGSLILISSGSEDSTQVLEFSALEMATSVTAGMAAKFSASYTGQRNRGRYSVVCLVHVCKFYLS